MFVNGYSDIPPDVLTFTVTVLNKGKRAKDSEVAEVTIDLNNLANGEEVRVANAVLNSYCINH